jgi:hypothetical protein
LIVDRAVVRGALTAIGWLTNDKVGLPVKDMHEAITTADQALTRAGLRMPAGLDAARYRAPLPSP